MSKLLHLFFSYAREDQALVRRVRTRVKLPLRPWIDERDLATGVRFPERIRSALQRECAFAVIFLSDAAVASPWVREEIEWALEREAWMRRSATARQRDAVPFVLPMALAPADAWPVTQVPESLRDHNVFWPTRADRAAEQIAQCLQEAIFGFSAAALANQRLPLAAAAVDSLEADLQTYQDLAYRMTAVLRNPVRAIAFDHAVEAELIAAIVAYNEFAKPFNGRLPQYAAQIRRAYGMNLGDAADRFVLFFEEQVYRGQVYALNQVTAVTNSLQTAPQPQARLPAALDDQKNRLLAQVRETLVELTRRASELVGALKREAITAESH